MCLPPRRGRPRRAAGGWLSLLALSSALTLAGCGGSHASAVRNTTESHSQTATSSAGYAPAQNGVCHTAQAPKPRPPQHIPKPTLQLDPTKSYTVSLSTNCGQIEIALAAATSPQIAASFAYLVKLGFYDRLTFHRVVTDFVIQGGDPNGDGSGGPGYTVTEPPPSDTRYRRGTVAMAKTATEPPGTAGSQFFIVLSKHTGLPPQFAILGKVVGGWRTVIAISHVSTATGPDGNKSYPSTPIVIEKASLKVR